jgi:diguanylate cyclase (GGDEF)-like protein/PAS domain S-box-containing protein
MVEFSDSASAMAIFPASPSNRLLQENRILVIDDQGEDLQILRATLAAEHYEVFYLHSGREVFDAILVRLPHLILLRIDLPDIDSDEVCKRLKANPKTQAIPVILISASNTGHQQLKAFEMGCADYIQSPLQPEEVRMRVRNQFDLQATRRQLNQLNQELEQRVLERTLQLQTVHQRLKASEERLESILNTLQDVVWSAAIQPFQILYLNPAATTLYQRPLDDFLVNSDLWLEMIHPDDRTEVIESINAMTGRGTLDIEYRIIRSNGETRWVRNRSRLVIGDRDDVSVRIEGLITDISDRKRAEKQLIHDALHDGLTQLPNRTLFIERLETALKRQRRRPDYQFAVLFLDLNRFKLINDSLGHGAGDRLLVEVANRLLQCIRSIDTVARLGGDEFTILLDDIADTDDVFSCVRRIQTELGLPVEINGNPVFTGCSIGVVIAHQHYAAAADLLRDADIAMYRAKEKRQAGYELFDQAMHDQSMRRLKLENDLRTGLERQEFELHYQPIMTLEKQTLLGFEALVRWRHPDEGMISPGEFIPIAEETGLIVPLGNWILEQACGQICQWQRRYPQHRHLKININVTSQQFREPSLLSTLDALLAKTCINGECLRLELTESTLIHETEATIDTLNKIRQRNIQISIDDFGTGYSSLSYLSRFPINNLKIDQSFVGRMHLEAENLEIVRTITTLAHTLDMDVTAEGIERSEQIEKLQEFGCEYGQGYFFSPPLTADAAEKQLITWAPLGLRGGVKL